MYAVNFFNGCSNGCSYCYNKRGVASKVCGAPIIDFESSLKMFYSAASYVNEFRIGLMSPYKKGRYTKEGMKHFVHRVLGLQRIYGFEIMWKQSFRKLAKEYGIELTENVNLYGREEIDRTEIEG